MAIVTQTQGPARKSAPTLICNSFEDFADWLASTPETGKMHQYKPDLAQRRLALGDMAAADKADAMLASIEAQSVYGEGMAVTRAVAGGFPDVPAYMAGSPVAMRRRGQRETLAPLTVVVETYMSGSVPDSARLRRAAAIVALVRRLTMLGHAVDLWLAHTSAPDGEATGTVLVRAETRPLDLARVAYACVASVDSEGGYKRSTMEAMLRITKAQNLGFYSAWGVKNWSNTPANLAPYYASALGVDPAALVAVPGLDTDNNHPFGSDRQALQWVNQNYAAALAKAGH